MRPRPMDFHLWPSRWPPLSGQLVVGQHPWDGGGRARLTPRRAPTAGPTRHDLTAYGTVPSALLVHTPACPRTTPPPGATMGWRLGPGVSAHAASPGVTSRRAQWRLNAITKLLDKIFGMKFPPLFGCRSDHKLGRVRGWAKNLSGRLLGPDPHGNGSSSCGGGGKLSWRPCGSLSRTKIRPLTVGASGRGSARAAFAHDCLLKRPPLR
jgi:hypothetical protein